MACVISLSPVQRAPILLRRQYTRADAAFRCNPCEAAWIALRAAVLACIAYDNAMRGKIAA
jgi:hypothetical protein